MHPAIAKEDVYARGCHWLAKDAGSQAVHYRLQQEAPAQSVVLILGEPGTGKRLAARLLHSQGRRPDAPFIQVDCRRLWAHRDETALFGEDASGAFEQARGGTLFLEAIEGLPLAMQAQLAAVLALTPPPPPGARQPVALEVRVVASTDQDLVRWADAGRFHGTLLLYLAHHPMRLPPLRRRREDILPLARSFLHHTAARLGQYPPLLSLEAQRALLAYDWPGNVWELKRVMERAVMQAGEVAIRVEHVPPFPPDRGDAEDSVWRDVVFGRRCWSRSWMVYDPCKQRLEVQTGT